MPTLPPRAAEAAGIVPSARQLAWQALEFCALIHFGLNTFTGKEWGDGTEDPALFCPKQLDCRQWAKICRAAGMRGLILVAKSHNGFCLWPTKTTTHSVAASPWKGGAGDLVREAAEACREIGLRFGVALSPYDRHEPSYGTAAYNDMFKAQLRELCSEYGELFEVWFGNDYDEGGQDYDWQGYYEIIRELQPNAAISSLCEPEPDIRWVGNDLGVCRSSEWSVVPQSLTAAEEELAYWDLGSHRALKRARNTPLRWYPAEVSVPLRRGWFYREGEDIDVKPLSKLRDIYYKSVGANASLLLGISPAPTGRIAERDTETLLSLGAQLKVDFRENLAEGSVIAETCRLNDAHTGQMALEAGGSYWHSGPLGLPGAPKTAALVLDLGDDYDIDKVLLREHIATGQQIEKFSLWYDENTGPAGKSKWKPLARGTVIGHKRVCLFDERRMRRLKLVIERARGFATIESFEAY